MCSISGFLVTDPKADREKLADFYTLILERSAERGQDSAGVVSIDIHGVTRRETVIAPSDYRFARKVITPETSVMIGNNRAEPTTEYVAVKKTDDVQPFGNGRFFITHNGTIANDKELQTSYNISTSSKIDSAVLPDLISQLGIKSSLQHITGSYALAILDTFQPEKLWLACNYKSIYLQYIPTIGGYFFASRPDYLINSTNLQNQLHAPAVVKIPPYHLVEIDGSHANFLVDEIQPRIRNRKALVICSGGLDSTVAARWAQQEGYEITLLHFLYHCRAEKREVAAVKAIAKELDCDFRLENLDWLGKIGGSSLTDESIEITRNETSAEYAHEWVPARNLIFIAMAAGLCDRYGFDTIIMGLNLEEGGAYPDNTVEFYKSVDHVCDIGTMSRPRILCPVGNMVKHQIVRLGLEIGAPLHLSWSCYYGEEIHCGHCGPCFMRKTAFRMIGVPDVISYAC